MTTLSFAPGPIPAGQLGDWQKMRTLSHVVNPSGTAEIGAFATAKTDFTSGSAPVTKGTFHAERAVFFGRWDHFPHHLVPLYTKTYTLFDSLQQIAEQEQMRREEAGGSSSALPSSEQISFYSRLASLYIDTLRQHLASTSTASEQGPSEEESEWAAITQIFHLTKILYIPEDGRGEGVVGEELLDFGNRLDAGPTTEEGEDILDSSRPWEHEKFWNYLIRSLLRGFLASAAQLILTLSSHPSPTLARLAPRLSSLLEAYPRSSSSAYTTERSFLNAHSAWRSQLRTLIRTIAASGWAREGSWTEDDNEEDADDLEARVKEVVEVLEGKEQRVLEESADWSEALGAWGIWVRPSLKRDDLPETINHILQAIPAPQEGYLPEELILQALCTSDLTKAITLSNTSISSPWLVTHLTDLLEKVGVLEGKLEDRTRSLRDHFVLEYAEHLGSDKGLWRMACAYLGTCGEEGKRRVGVLLERVALEVEGGEKVDEVDEEKVDEVFKMMQSFGLEEESRTLLRLAGEQMIRRRNYGVAVAYCIRAGDGRRLGVIAEKVLDEYVRHGPTEFIEHVNSIPPSLFSPDSPHYIAGPSSSGPAWANGPDGNLSHHHEAALANPTFPVLASKLSFLPMYRDFLEAYGLGEKRRAAELLVKMLVNGVAPTGFWAILLLDSVPLLEDAEILIPSSDAYELLRHLEEVVSASSHSPSDYLTHLANLRTSKRPASRPKLRPRMSNGAVPTAIPAGNEQEEGYTAALKGLEVVRLALARYLAREVLG